MISLTYKIFKKKKKTKLIEIKCLPGAGKWKTIYNGIQTFNYMMTEI